MGAKSMEMRAGACLLLLALAQAFPLEMPSFVPTGASALLQEPKGSLFDALDNDMDVFEDMGAASFKPHGSSSSSSSFETSSTVSETVCNNGECHQKMTTNNHAASKGCQGKDCHRISHNENGAMDCQGANCDSMGQVTDCTDGHCKKKKIVSRSDGKNTVM